MTTTLPAGSDTPARLSRRAIYAAVALQADLPTPRMVAFSNGDQTIDVYLDRVADLHAWLPYFGMTTKDVSAQPYTHEIGPGAGQASTLANAYNHDGWRGWTVHLNALDPVGEPEPTLDDVTREQLRAVVDEPEVEYGPVSPVDGMHPFPAADEPTDASAGVA